MPISEKSQKTAKEDISTKQEEAVSDSELAIQTEKENLRTESRENLSDEELQRLKLLREIDKLEADKIKADEETKELKKLPFFRAGFVFVLFPALLSLLAATATLYVAYLSPQLVKIENANKEIANKNEQIANQDKEISNNNVAIQELAKQKDKLDEQIASLSERTDAEKKEKERLLREKESIERESNEIKLAKNRVDTALQVLMAQAVVEQSRIATLIEKQKDLEAQAKFLEERRTKLEEDVAVEAFRGVLQLLDREFDSSDKEAVLNALEDVKNTYNSDPKYKQTFIDYIVEHIKESESSPAQQAEDYWILYNLTNSASWKTQLFDLARKHLAKLCPIQRRTGPACEMLDSIVYQTISPKYFLSDTDKAEGFSLLLELQKKYTGNVKQQLRERILDEFNDKDYNLENPELFYKVLVIARDDFWQNYKSYLKTKEFESNSRNNNDFHRLTEQTLRQKCLAAYTSLLGKMIAESEDIDERRQIFTPLHQVFVRFDSISLKMIGEIRGFPNNPDDKEIWGKWLNQNKNTVDIWLDTDLHILKQNPELCSKFPIW